jgi:hypothetical protein
MMLTQPYLLQMTHYRVPLTEGMIFLVETGGLKTLTLLFIVHALGCDPASVERVKRGGSSFRHAISFLFYEGRFLQLAVLNMESDHP